MKGKILSELAHFHQAFPAQPGMPSAQLKSAIGISEESLFLELALENLKEAKNIKQVGTNYALHTHRISLGEREEELKVAMLSRIQEAGLATVKAHPLAEQLKATVEEIETLIAILEGLGEVVRLERDSAISTHIYNQCLKKLRVLEQEQGMITLPEAVKILGSSRRVTVSLLEYLDSAGMTERIGDERRFK
jgi:selenocysteine-specific elongation factor